jgi:hypothetical protein
VKKTLILIGAVAFMTVSSFAQGNIYISDSARGIWGIDYSGTARLGPGLDWSLIAGPAATTPSVDSIMTSTPTNTIGFFDPSTAWNDILNQPGYFFVDGTNGAAIEGAVAANGSVNYNASIAFSAANLIGGTTNTMYLIAWSSAYATPSAAQAAGAAVGWSNPFQYLPTSGINTPNYGVTMNSAGLSPFGVGPVPEPTTVALAGLGGLALLGLRRRN